MSDEVEVPVPEPEPEPVRDVGVFVSRVIEFLPITLGNGVIVARDCVHNSQSYSKGSVIKTETGTYTCTGDKDGTWKKKL
jgi:hypothetical protein